tara:strand:+ start:2123 stop:3754 length:1632 start_codon:yes stop_codon:yes gene_type:complete
MDKNYTQDDIRSAIEFTIANSTARNPAQWMFETFAGGIQSDSAVSINYNSALTYSAVFSATSLIAGDIGTTPLNVYSIDKNGDREIDTLHNAQWLLNEEPNELMNADTFRETLQSHALLWGNGFAAIERDGAMRPTRLIPLLPDEWVPELRNGTLIYRHRNGRDDEGLMAHNVLHIRGLTYDGIAGHSVISLARNSWGLGLTAEKHGNTSFKNGARPSIVLSTDQKIGEDEANLFLSMWEEQHGNAQNRPAILGKGLSVQPFSMSNDDAQWLDSRKFQRVEVASWFSLPPHKIGDDSRISYNSIEAENRAYVGQTLGRWLGKWEKECTRKLIAERVRRSRTKTIQHDRRGLIEPDLETKVSVLTSLRASEDISSNELRRELGWNRREGGDDYINPNVRPADQSTPADGDESALDARARDGQRRAFRDRMAKLINTEAARVTKEAKKAAGFTTRIDKFYDTFSGKVAEALDPLIYAYSTLPGVKCAVTATELAQQHVDESRESLLSVAGYSFDDETLHHHVTESVASWDTRAADIANTIVGVDQ